MSETDRIDGRKLKPPTEPGSDDRLLLGLILKELAAVVPPPEPLKDPA